MYLQTKLSFVFSHCHNASHSFHAVVFGLFDSYMEEALHYMPLFREFTLILRGLVSASITIHVVYSNDE
jgi:hypothetical protein